MYDRLLTFLNKNDILNKYQFGFRNNHSTYMALVILLENLRNALDNGECAIGIFVDFQKAFDTVDHCILLDKLYMYGVRGTTLDWFSSYLNDRYQYVVYNDCKSDCKSIKCGVPQGSILGPLLFLILSMIYHRSPNGLCLSCLLMTPTCFVQVMIWTWWLIELTLRWQMYMHGL